MINKLMERTLFLILILVSHFVSAEVPVYFADSNLKIVVENTLGIKNPTEQDMLKLERLKLNKDRGIKNLIGLEHAKNLSELGISYNNEIKDLSPIVDLSNLSKLFFIYRDRSQLTDLKNLTKLKYLAFWHCPLSDISFIKEHPNLREFHLGWNHLSDISPIMYLTNLESLSIGHNEISDITPITGLNNLEYLTLMENQISRINPVSTLANLKILRLDRNNISDIQPLSKLTNLEHLWIYENKIEDISPLSALSNLNRLYVYENNIEDISPLSTLSNLTHLYIFKNKIADISPLSSLKQIENLIISYNSISDISPLVELTELKHLKLNSNKITNIASLSNHEKLNLLYLYNNPLGLDACESTIPKIIKNNPDIDLKYDPCGKLYSVEINSTKGGVVTNPGEGTITWNDTYPLTINAMPDENYQFLTWTGNAVESSTISDIQDNQAIVQVTSNETLTANFTPIDINYPGSGYLLGKISFQDENEFNTTITSNNETQVNYIVGQEPDPTGMMELFVHNTSSARAKAVFEQTSRDKVSVQFKYLFTDNNPNLELVAYLSDVPELLSLNDQDRQGHYQEVIRISPPPIGRPGSINSGRFALFSREVDVNGLDLTNGTYLELELRVSSLSNPASSMMIGFSSSTSSTDSILADDLSVGVLCSITCMNINRIPGVDETDLMSLVATSGYNASLDSFGGSSHCCEGLFSEDGYIDKYDILGFDWTAITPHKLPNLCGLDLSPTQAEKTGSDTTCNLTTSVIEDPIWISPGLILAGKRGRDGGNIENKSSDGIFSYDCNGTCNNWCSPNHRGIVRVVSDSNIKREMYVVSSIDGLLKINDNGTQTLICPATYPVTMDPSYGIKNVHIGVLNNKEQGAGRPIMDVAIDNGIIYVVPVVVEPEVGSSFIAAAKLERSNSKYTVTAVYNLQTISEGSIDNPKTDGLREIAIDKQGHVFVLNVNQINESDMLVMFDESGELLDYYTLGNSKDIAYTPNPMGMAIDTQRNRLYLASGQVQHDKVIEIKEFSWSDSITHLRTITVSNISHFTDMSISPSDGILWVVGYKIDRLPQAKQFLTGGTALTESSFYRPYLASVPLELLNTDDSFDNIDAISLDGFAGDLAYPTSILWID